jgi:FG-GAP-like repeat
VAYLGMTSSNQIVSADVGFDSTTQEQVIYTFLGPIADSTVNIGVIPISGESPVSLAAANLAGGTGISDLVVVNESSTTSGSGSIAVIPVDATGTFGTPTLYSLPGQQGLSAVVDDFNGDGKLDIVATSSTFTSGSATTYYLTYLQGEGNGSFANPQNVTLTPGTVNQPYFGLISADLRNSGKKDLVTAAGILHACLSQRGGDVGVRPERGSGGLQQRRKFGSGAG